MFARVTSVKRIYSTGPDLLYNLEVEEDQSYIANGIVVHNCNDWADQDMDGLGAGVYKPENVPLDHPNGLCYVTHELTKPRELLARMNEMERRGLLGKGAVRRVRAAGRKGAVPRLTRSTVTTFPTDTSYGVLTGEEFDPVFELDPVTEEEDAVA